MLRYCYYINLDKRTDRKEHIEKELSKSDQLYQIFKRFPAVDGTTIHPRDVKEGLLTENAICDILANKISAWGLSLTQGGLGVLLSYLALFDEISKLDSPAIVFEDDSVLVNNFDEKLDKITSQLPDDFDICYLGYADMPIQKEYYSEDLSIPKGMIVCLPSIIVSPAGAEKLLNLLNNIDNQVDTAIYHHLDKLNAFVSNEKIVNIPNELGTDIQGNINCGKKYKTQNYIIATLAHGDFPNDNVVRLARDLRYFDQKLLVVTNKPELFKGLENVIAVKYPDKRFSYNDKILCFEEGFKLADAVVYVDSDCRIFYEDYKKSYGNLKRIIPSGFHPSWDWGRITRPESGFFYSTDIPNRVGGYGEKALGIAKLNNIDINNSFHYQEGIIIISKENGKEQLFLDMWKKFSLELDNYELANNSDRIGAGEGNLIGMCVSYSNLTVNKCDMCNYLGKDILYNFYGISRNDYINRMPTRKLVINNEGILIKSNNCEVNFKEKTIYLKYDILKISEDLYCLSFEWDLKDVEYLDHEFKINDKIYHFNSEKNNEFYFEKLKNTIYHTYDWYGEKKWEIIENE